MDTAIKIGLYALKTAFKKLFAKIAEATGEFIGNKSVDKVVKSKPSPKKNSKNVEETVIPPGKRCEKLNELKHVFENGTP